jgi:hypothetical protein
VGLCDLGEHHAQGGGQHAPAIRPSRELSGGDAGRLYEHYDGTAADRNRGARRARGRGPVGQLRAPAVPPARSAAAWLREARDRGLEAGRSGRPW